MRIVAAAGLFALVSCSQLVAETTDPAINQLSWLAGTWTNEHEGEWSEEHWSVPRAGMMIGTGRSGEGNTLASFEFLRVETQDEIELVYFAAPGGGDATAFALSEVGPNSVTFINAEHDFPQRIRYSRDGATLAVEIALADGSEAISWELTRQE